MEERSLRQCKGDWQPNGEKERMREEARAREGNVRERTGRDEWLDEKENEARCMERMREKDGAHNQRGNPRCGRSVEESPYRAAHQSGTVRCPECTANHRFFASSCHVILFRVSRSTARAHVRSPVPSGSPPADSD